uniref:N-acetyltransferase domain-containing protein n=1 Tax=Leersia perrieri TaxID=77586 RepID=A0A0D9WIN7_9ORYZ
MRPAAMAAAAAAAKLPRLTTSAALFPSPRPFNSRPAKPTPPPISISMDPAHVDPAHLQALMLACSHSCAVRLSPQSSASATAAEPVDLRKLRVALAHSFLVVSVFCSARFLEDGDGDGGGDGDGDGDGRRLMGLGLGLGLGLGQREDQRLVGFGRAVSDIGLTASVHDVVVHPTLQRRGIGLKIVDRITRVLHNRGIFDISTLCTEKERPFFQACGFGDDALGSTTMMYTGKMHR